MVYLAKGGFWFSFGHVISVAVTFGMAVLFARFVPADVYGTYKFILSVLAILAISNLTRMGGIFSQAVARGMDGSMFEVLRTKMRWGSLGSFASLCVAGYYFLQGNTLFTFAFVITAAFLPFMDSFLVYQDYLQGKKRFDMSIPYFSMSQVIAAAVMAVVILITHNVNIILGAYLVSWTAVRGFFFLRAIKKVPPNDKTDPHTIPYGKHASVADVIATLIGSWDQIIVFHFLGPVPLAVYSFAIAPISQLVTPFKNLPILAMPKLAARPVEQIHGMIKKRLLVAFLVAALVTAAYILLAPFLFQIFFPKYLASIGISRLYALTVLFSLPSIILTSAINAKVTHLPKKLLYVWNIPSLLATLFILGSVQRLGVAGVAYGRILSAILVFIIACLVWLYIAKRDSAKPTSV